MGTFHGCCTAKFDSCNNLRTFHHTEPVIILRDVRLNSKENNQSVSQSVGRSVGQSVNPRNSNRILKSWMHSITIHRSIHHLFCSYRFPAKWLTCIIFTTLPFPLISKPSPFLQSPCCPFRLLSYLNLMTFCRN